MTTNLPFFELFDGDFSCPRPEALARLPLNFYSSLNVSSKNNNKKLATIPWILVNLKDRKLLCRAVPAVNDSVEYVEASSNLWIPKNEAIEDENIKICSVDKLLKKPKFAENVIIETEDEFEEDEAKFLALMRATLVHKPICEGLHFKIIYNLDGDRNKKLIFKVKTIKKEVSSDEFAIVAPQTTFTLFKSVKVEGILSCPVGLEIPFAQISDLLDPKIMKQMRAIGVSLPRGILMSGPPGVGKTFLVRHIAEHSLIPLKVINGPELLSPIPGESEKNLLKIFEEAEVAARGNLNNCALVFFDEVDAIARKREADNMQSLSEVRLLTQLLMLMDGYERTSGTTGHVIVMAATNRPNSLDPAMRRPGRFDREIVFEPPDALTRTKILTSLLSNFDASEVDLNEIGRNCVGYVSADLASLVQEIALELSNCSCKLKKENFVQAMKRVGPSLHRQYQVALDNRITWADIAGIEDIKDELRRYIEWPLLHADVYERMGIIAPRGVLLYGPPGCSKTTIAKAIANESGFTFYSLNGAALYSCYVGESEQQIRDIFQCARMTSPSVIFFDEIDAIVGKRSSEFGVSGGDSVQERVLSTLLNEMDGICGNSNSKKNVLVIGATNRRDLIDDALLRPGRFDRHIYIPPPNEKGRIEILSLFLKNREVDPSVNIFKLAAETEGFTGADLKGLVQEAGILAMHDESFKFKMEHFERVLKTPGRKRN